MKIENFWITHINSKKVVSDILTQFDNIIFEMYFSIYEDKAVSFSRSNYLDMSIKDISRAINILKDNLEEEFDIYRNSKDMLQ